MLRKTIVRREIIADSGFAAGMHPVLARVYAGRNIDGEEELDYSLERLLPFHRLSHIHEAAALLAESIANNSRLLIVADYDVDGATACALAIRGLKSMGAENVEFVVPDRFEHGYGLSPQVVELAAGRKPDVLITVDNGISSVAGVELARSMGMRVLITDHHLPGETIPAADVIVNPNLPDDGFPSKSLAGVGVMFYVLAALRAKFRELGWFADRGIPEPRLSTYLDLVALGTVADVVALDHNNRILVAQGLQRIRQGQCVEGLKALLLVAKRSFSSVVAGDLGFAVGPRLNAAGRLSDMSLGIECLCCDDYGEALSMARQLDDLNRERRDIQSDMESEAMTTIEALDLQSLDELPHGICLYRENWHQGVVGILASKVREKTHRPVIIFACEAEGMLKGSARSIRDIHIRDVIEAIATANPGLVAKYGGHAMAAGLSLAETNYDRFCALFDERIAAQIRQRGFDSELLSDGSLKASDISLLLGEQLRNAGPWGQGFPEPLFDGIFRLIDRRIVGDNHLKLSLAPKESEKVIDAIAFNTTDENWPDRCNMVQAAYRLDVNEFRGRKTPQLLIEYIEPLPDGTAAE